MKITCPLFFAASVSFFASACLSDLNCEKGHGPVVSRELNLSPFHSINLAGLGNVFLTQGPEQRVQVDGQENIIDLLELNVTNGKWNIGFAECIKNADGLQFHIAIPQINEIGITGSGNVETVGQIESDHLLLKISGSGNLYAEVEADQLQSEITGSGNIEMSGSATTQNVRISGSGNVRSFDLSADEVDVNISGSGHARVAPINSLTVRISGSGNVYYKGNPDIDISISGSGKVERQ